MSWPGERRLAVGKSIALTAKKRHEVRYGVESRRKMLIYEAKWRIVTFSRRHPGLFSTGA